MSDLAPTLPEPDLGHPPERPSRWVRRPRLLQRLDESVRTARLTLVHAPVGYGKSQLLGSWTRALRRRGSDVVWIDADEELADVDGFLGNLVARVASSETLRHVQPAKAPALPRASGREAVRWFGTLRANGAAALVVVIDDYDRAASDQLDQMLGDVIRAAGPMLHFVLVSKLPLRIPLGSGYIAGAVEQIDGRELRFTDDEITELFGHALSDEDLGRISVWTEGWPVAVQLARHYLAEPGTSTESMEGLLTRADGDVARYLTEQVLEQLPEQQRELLLQTSFLEAFTTELAEAVTGIDGAWRILHQLETSNPLIEAIEEPAGTRYRCHRLLRDVMFADLRRRGRRELVRLRSAAAAWFEGEGNLREAIRHAQAAGDLELLTRMLLQAGGIFYGVLHGAPPLRAMMECMPASVILGHPRLAAAQAFLLAKEGRFDAAADLTGSVRRRNPAALVPGSAEYDALLDRDLAMAEVTTATYAGVIYDDEQIGTLQRVILASPAQDDWLRGVLHNIVCVAHYRRSDFIAANRMVEAANYHYGLIRSSNGLGHMGLHAGLIAMEIGDVPGAIRQYESARYWFANGMTGDDAGGAMSEVLLSEALYEHGDIEEATALCERALRFAQSSECHYELLIAGYRTLTALVAMDRGPHEAIRALGDGLAYAKRRNFIELDRYLLLRRIELEMMVGDNAALNVRSTLLPGADTWVEDEARMTSWRDGDLARLVQARLALSAGEYAEALPTLERHAAVLDAAGRVRNRIAALILLAQGYEGAGSRDTALQRLRTAIVLAAPGNFLAPFLEQGRSLLPMLVGLGRPAAATSMAAASHEIAFVEHAIRRIQDLYATEAPLFSEREQEIVALLADGQNNKLIARSLGISPETVRFHLKNIYEKFGVSDRKLVIELAQKRGFVH